MNARVSAITAFRLTTAEPETLARFYEGLGFAVGARESIPEDEIELLGLSCGGTRLPLRLGGQRVDLDSFEQRGRPYPCNPTSADLCFQHFALVSDDAQAAWARAMGLGARPISVRGPVTLPVSAGNVTAAKFRDPEGHPLEILQFPEGSGQRWQATGFLGIDHSAISVSDVVASRRFYEELGLSVQGPTVNRGPTQEALDALTNVVVDVLPMMPPCAAPHVELLAYGTPRGHAAVLPRAIDIAATRTVWAADRDALIPDPDGHLHLLRR